ncbi:MAG: TatD family hydrolase, partial [Clostridia bacterium]|nr:TatD family hydrolase [Clostridia bacterium]
TDCPYLAPQPYRGKINHSGLMHSIAEMQAELHNVAIEQIAATTANNAKKLFNIS